MDLVTTWTVTGPIYDGQLPQPAAYDGMTAERHITPLGLWEATLAMWPSIIQPPYGVSEGWLWIWNEVGGVRVWRICSVY